jgi:hypothetical protein
MVHLSRDERNNRVDLVTQDVAILEEASIDAIDARSGKAGHTVFRETGYIIVVKTGTVSAGCAEILDGPGVICPNLTGTLGTNTAVGAAAEEAMKSTAEMRNEYHMLQMRCSVGSAPQECNSLEIKA